MSITILTASDVDELIADPASLEQAIASQREILTEFSAPAALDPKNAQSQAIQIPPRISLASENVTALCMPSRVKILERNHEIGTGIGVKVVSVPHEGGAGLPATTTLFDGRTGKLQAVVNARNLTALRNACGEQAVRLSRI
jgi:ornithine cyclodeaminase/alanine dehydrogenase-like protein (mu-crystallin family)